MRDGIIGRWQTLRAVVVRSTHANDSGACVMHEPDAIKLHTSRGQLDARELNESVTLFHVQIHLHHWPSYLMYIIEIYGGI